MINYIEYGIRFHDFIKESGHSLIQKDGEWISSDDVAVQALIDNYDPLSEAKTDAKQRVTLHASQLVADIYPFINPEKEEAVGLYHFTTDLYLSIKSASRNALSGRLLEFKGIYDTAQVKIAEVNAMTDWQLVDAYDATVGW